MNNSGVTQSTATSWDVVVLSFKILYQRLLLWIRLNFQYLLFSIPLVTAPGATAALYFAVVRGLRDPAGNRIIGSEEMKEGFSRFKFRALGLFVIKWIIFFVIVFSIFFWIRQDSWWLRSFSVIGFYTLLLWMLSEIYLYPVMVDNPDLSIFQVLRNAVDLAFIKPFETLLLMVVSNLLLFFGLILLGPVMLVIPALQAILRMQIYWFITGKVIPGFMDLVQYTNEYG